MCIQYYNLSCESNTIYYLQFACGFELKVINQIIFCTWIVLISEMMVVDDYFPPVRDGVLFDSLITLAYGGKLYQ